MFRVELRKLRTSDANALAILMNNKKIWDNLRDYVPFPYALKDAQDFIKRDAEDTKNAVFAIDFNKEFCGIIGLFKGADVYRKSAEIGYWVGEPFWGRGIMTEAVRLIIDLGFSKLDLVRIHAGIFDFNRSSMRVLEKNGFVKEGVFKNGVIKNNKICDEHRYALLNPNNVKRK